MLNWVQIPARDGGQFDAHLVRPSGGAATGVVVCIQEIFGVNHAMRDIAQEWADKGYIAIAPDLFWRQEPHVDITDGTDEEWQKAFQLYQDFDADKGIEDLKATVDYARKLDGSNGKVGTVGFCLGGKMAYLMACRSDTDCNVGYYGVGIEEQLDEAAKIEAPLILHIAEEDGFVPKEAQVKVKEALADNPNVTIHSYPGMDHAFARIGGKPYDKKNADLANGRTDALFAKVLKG